MLLRPAQRTRGAGLGGEAAIEGMPARGAQLRGPAGAGRARGSWASGIGPPPRAWGEGDEQNE